MSDGLIAYPTCDELVVRGLAIVAERNKKGEPIVYKIHEAGYEVIYSAMKHNARLLATDDVLRREGESNAVRNAKNGVKK